MEKLISSLSLFLIASLLYGFLYFQWNLSFDVLFNDKPSVPVIVLSFGPALQLVTIWLIFIYLERIPSRKRLFPRLAIFEFEDAKIAFFWEKVSVAAILGLPLLSFGWSWISVFSAGTVFLDHSSSSLPDRRMFDYVSPSLMFGEWNTYRYGNEAANEGASFVPFWQPVFIMGGGTLVVLATTIRLLFVVRNRVAGRTVGLLSELS